MANQVEDIERRLRQLREKLNAGAISSEQFESEIEKLHFTDALGRTWMIGAQSSKWYYHDGQKWVQATPPKPKTPPPVKAQPNEDAMTTIVRKQPPTSPPPPKAESTAKSQWMWLSCAGLAVLALLVVAILLVAGIYFLNQEEPGMATPTRAAVLPMPVLATATPTPAAAIIGEPTPTPALANDPAVLLDEADKLMLKSKYNEALARYRKAAELDPARPTLYTRWARALRLVYPPQFEEGLGKATTATRLAPNSAEAFTELALQNLRLGRTTEAVTSAQQAVALDQKYAPGHAALAEIYLSSGRTAEGVTEAQLAVQTDPNSTAGRLAAAHALILLDQGAAALDQIQAAVKLEPEVAEHYVEQGTQFRRLVRFDEAIKSYEKAIALDGNQAPAYDGLGRAYFSGPGNYDKAQQAFAKAVELAPLDASAYSGSGYVQLVKGNPAGAVESFNKALALAPGLQEAKDGLLRATETKVGAPAAGSTQVAAVSAVDKASQPAKKPAAVADTGTPGAPGEAAAGAPQGTDKKPAAPKAAQPAAPPAQLSGRIIFPVYHADQANYDIYWRNADGSGDAVFLMGEASQPAASSDGKSLAFRRWKRDGRGIVAMDLAGEIQGGNYRRLTSRSLMEDAMPAWAPNGNTLVFFSRRESDRKPRLFLVPSTGGGERALEQNFKPILGVTPTWLKDGRILYSGCVGQDCGLFAVNADGANPQQITKDSTDSAPAVSPDGSRIAFMSQRDGNWEVYVVNVDGTGLVRLTTNHANDGLPVWSPDGSSIAYASDTGGAWSLWVMGADGSNARQLFAIAGSFDGRVAGEDDTKSRGWLEERISWVP